MSITAIFRICAVLVMMGGVACSSDSTSAPNDEEEIEVEDANAVGIWLLATVNGAPLPYVLTSPDGSVSTVAADITFTAAGTYSLRVIFDFASPSLGLAGRDTATSSGTFAQTGNTVSTTGSTGSHSTATIGGNHMTEHDGSTVYVYIKQ